MYIIGVDVGGTNIKCGIIDYDRIVYRIEEPTNTFDLVRQVENIVKRVMLEYSIDSSMVTGVGVGFPGMVIDGVVIYSANIGLSECNLAQMLSDDLQMNVKVMNDGNMAVLGEHRFGGGMGCKNLVMLTIGTGVGGGIIANGELYEGNGGGELGHIIFEKNGRPCNCGRHGCAESYVSYNSLTKNARELMERMPNRIPLEECGVTAKGLMYAYKNNDECAKIIIDRYVEDFSEVLLDYCNIFRPDKIIIGGGLSYTEEIIGMVAKKCKEKNFGYSNACSVEIIPAALKNNAGILGAGVLF